MQYNISAARLETFMFETVPMDKIGVTNERQTNLEYLGTDMIEGGNEFGVGTPYGKFRGRGFRCSRFATASSVPHGTGRAVSSKSVNQRNGFHGKVPHTIGE